MSKFFSIFAQILRKVEEMKDYQLTSDGLYDLSLATSKCNGRCRTSFRNSWITS